MANRKRRSLFWLVALPAVMMPVAMATGDPFVPFLLGGLVVIAWWWGIGEKVSLTDGLLLGGAAAIVGPFLWFVLNVLFFAFEYFATAANVALNGMSRVPQAQDFLAFLRSEFTKAVTTRVLPMISPSAMVYVLFIAIPSALGGAVAALVTASPVARSGVLRGLVDFFLLWRTEREEDDFERTARDHPELLTRAGELSKAGFDDHEARRIALAEFRDPILNPPPRGGQSGSPTR